MQALTNQPVQEVIMAESNSTLAARACVKCGANDRYSNGKCRPCAMAGVLAWKSRNAEKLRASNAAYASKNPEKVKAWKNKWASENKEKIKDIGAIYKAANPGKFKAAALARVRANPEMARARSARWAKLHPEPRRIAQQNRRAKKVASGGVLSKGLSAKLFILQKGMCPCCKLPLGDDYHLDHRMPLALGGANTDDNMQLLRAICNLQKKAKHPVDFMQERGFLL